MDKRSDTVSFRLPPAMRRQLEAVALAHETTLSDLIYQLALERLERERRAYERLHEAFAANQGLPGLHDEDGTVE